MKFAVSIALFLLLAVAAVGQTVYIGAGPSVYPDAPYGALNLTFGPCTADGKTCELTSLEARGSAKSPKDLIYSTATGLRQVIVTAESAAMKADLFLIGQAGANVTGGAVGFAGSGGGGLTFHPNRAPNWSISFAGKAIYSPVNPGWKPWVHAEIGYTFRGK